MKRKILLIVCLLVIVSALTSCKIAERIMIDISKINNDDKYIEYIENNKKDGFTESFELYMDKGEVGGKYYNTISGEHKTDGSVHVSFSQNSQLNVKYYIDKDFTTEITDISCDLNPGDRVYAKVDLKAEAVSSSSYEFSNFEIFELNTENGLRTQLSDFKQDYENQGLVFEIPKDFTGNNVSVVPVGKYKCKSIQLEDYYTDSNNTKKELPGLWKINEKEYTSSQVEVSPIEPYIVGYQYDPDKYFFVNSEPECFFINEIDGTVVFKQVNPEEEVQNYKVELSEFLTLNIEVDTERLISINGGKEVKYEEGETLSVPELKYGDNITVKTNLKWETLENYRDFILIGEEREVDLKSAKITRDYSYVYTLLVPEKEGLFTFNPSDYSYAHGKVKFKCMGKTVYSTQVLAQGRKIFYEQLSADDGYYLPDGDNYVIVGNTESTKEQLKDIKFIEKKKVDVDLPQPEYGGRVSYFINGEEIKSKSVLTDISKKIVINFDTEEGWKCNYKDGYIYNVEKPDIQLADMIAECFQEDDEHKPKLRIILEKTLGENITFNFNAPELNNDDYHYEEDWFRNEYTVIKNKKIGTEQPLKITASNKALENNKVVRIEIEKIDSKNCKYTEVICYDDLTEDIPDIYVYSSDYLNNTKNWCKNLNIKIGIADADKFKSPNKQPGLIVKVFDNNTGKPIQENQLIDLDRELKVVFTTEDGYVFGKSNISSYTEILNLR